MSIFHPLCRIWIACLALLGLALGAMLIRPTPQQLPVSKSPETVIVQQLELDSPRELVVLCHPDETEREGAVKAAADPQPGSKRETLESLSICAHVP